MKKLKTKLEKQSKILNNKSTDVTFNFNFLPKQISNVRRTED